MELQDNYNLLQTNVISKLRDYPRFLCLLKTFANRFDNLQNAVNYLSDMLDVDKAEGIWLDYIAWLVGTTRDAYNILNFFCFNAPHINVAKEFYFEGITPDAKGNLQDVLLRKRIKAKIAYNTSKATRNENIRIIKNMFNADIVIITKVEPMVLDIIMYGDEIIYPSIDNVRDAINNLLGNGVGVRNLEIKPTSTFFLNVNENNESFLPTDEISYDINKEL